MKPYEPMARLLSGKPVSLAVWLAEPLSRIEAEAQLAAVRASLRAAHGLAQQEFGTRIAELITRYWCGQDTEMTYLNLLATLDSVRDRAQLQLCYGQLLIARKLEPAWIHLDAGFASAAHIFQPDDYFVVLKRHQVLRHLALSSVPARASALDELLQEAGVINRLRGGPGRNALAGSEHRDTVD